MAEEADVISNHQSAENKKYLAWSLAALALMVIAWFMHSGLKIPDIENDEMQIKRR